MKILLVEDEPFMQEAMSSVIQRSGIEVLKSDNIEAMSSVIQRSGIEVLKSDNIKDAIQILETEQINLLITDLYFPQPDGFELIKHVKNNPMTQQIPVIVVTGFESDRKNSSDKLQADLWLMKPFTLDELRKAIGKFVVEEAA